MAYIRFKVVNNDFGRVSCYLDAGLPIKVGDGDIIRVSAGTHVLKLEGETVEHVVQETIDDDECILIKMMLGPSRGTYVTTVVIGYPEYAVVTLDEDEKREIDAKLDAIQAEKERKSKRREKITNTICLILGLGVGSAVVVAVVMVICSRNGCIQLP